VRAAHPDNEDTSPRKCVWWVPDFTVEKYRDRLVELDSLIRYDGAFVATRHLIEARR